MQFNRIIQATFIFVLTLVTTVYGLYTNQQIYTTAGIPLASLCGFIMILGSFEAQRKNFEAQQKNFEAQQKNFEAQQKNFEAQQKNFEAQQNKFEAQEKKEEKKHHIKTIQTRLDYHTSNIRHHSILDEEEDLVYKGTDTFKYYLKAIEEEYYKVLLDGLIIISYAIIDKYKEEGNQTQAQIWNEQLNTSWHLEGWMSKCEMYFDKAVSQLELKGELKNFTPNQFIIQLAYISLFFPERAFYAWLKNNLNYEKLEEYSAKIKDHPIYGIGRVLGLFAMKIMQHVNNSSANPASEIQAEGDLTQTQENREDDVQIDTSAFEQPELPFGHLSKRDLQLNLGHYFRNLFSIFKYIDNIEDPSLKEDLAKLVRTQLSTYEQVIIFINSITTLGLDWELGQEGQNNKFITNYKIIHNIPYDLISFTKPSFFYPNMEYEYDKYLTTN